MESVGNAQIRWEKLRRVQQHYPHFVPFLEDVMDELGFGVTAVQADIAGFMEFGPANIMVMAQRSQAKTTIAAAFCVWCLLHNPRLRVLILSAAGSQASDISILIVRLIMTMDVLECMRPDRNSGDRSSSEAFDVHHSLKGTDKSPSVKCLGITANLQGNRADLLLADDIESAKNAMSAVQRAALLHLTKDFSSIVQKGRIIWLGTPQTGESIYNSLPGRGVTVRIWPGRYPTVEQLDNYGTYLAPYVTQRLAQDPSLGTGGGLLGDQGKPVDPELLDEDALIAKEMDQGAPYFQLQHMLNTKLLDKLRYPLKPEGLVLVRGAGRHFPLKIVRGMEKHHIVLQRSGDYTFPVTEPQETSRETGELRDVIVTIDPAPGGANADETGYAVGGELNSNVIVLGVGGVPGGYERSKLVVLAERVLAHRPSLVQIEKNMGYGAFLVVFTPIIREVATRLGIPQPALGEELVSGAKERRIVATLSPVIGRGSLIITPEAIAEDERCCEQYDPSQRESYSLFAQLAKMTTVANALVHDDRIDALEALVRKIQPRLAVDQSKSIEKLEDAAVIARINASLKSLGAPPIGIKNHRSMLRHKRK